MTADFTLDDVPPGENLSSKFQAKSQGVWEWTLAKPLTKLERGKLTISVADKQGNVTRVERSFSIK